MRDTRLGQPGYIPVAVYDGLNPPPLTRAEKRRRTKQRFCIGCGAKFLVPRVGKEYCTKSCGDRHRYRSSTRDDVNSAETPA